MWDWEKLHQNMQNSMSFQMEPNDWRNNVQMMKMQSAQMLFFLLQMLKCFLKCKLLRSAQLLRRPSKVQTSCGQGLFIFSLWFVPRWLLRSFLHTQFEAFANSSRIFFIFPLFSICSLLCSHHVPNMFIKFPTCSPRMFPIIPCFNPLCFAQSPPLLYLYRWAKGVDTL